jgi:hypothetical protein
MRETYAIVTKYIGPGCVQGSRVSARTKNRRTIIEWNPALSSELNHVRAARALARKLGWRGSFLGAMLWSAIGFIATDVEGKSVYREIDVEKLTIGG